jgi:hypothetical protein
MERAERLERELAEAEERLEEAREMAEQEFRLRTKGNTYVFYIF